MGKSRNTREYSANYQRERRRSERRPWALRHHTRELILRSILSRENASTLAEIRKDLNEIEYTLMSYHVGSLVERGILHKTDNYITGNGHFYSIGDSDEAQEAARFVEAKAA